MADGKDRRGDRPPRNLQDLYKMSVKTQDSENLHSGLHEEMSEERKIWLKEALATFNDDTFVKRMQECLKILDKNDDDNDEDMISAKESAFEQLESMVDLIDNANDLHKIGGFPIVVRYLNNSQSGLQWRAAEVLAVVAQNNPYSQAALTQMGVIPSLLLLVDNDPANQVQIKALYALSCLTRDFPPAEKELFDHDGISVLLRAMQGNVEKLKVKSAFMLRNIIRHSADQTLKDTLVNMGMVDQLVSLLNGPYEMFHEHVLSALAMLIGGNARALQESAKPELGLDKILNDKIKELQKDEDGAYEAEIECCKELQKLCCSDKNSLQDNVYTLR